MSWSLVSQGCYERPCDANELLLKAIVDSTAPIKRAQWTINTIAQLSVEIPDLRSALARAWLSTRHRAPSIACLVTDGYFTYEIPDQAAQDNWLANSFFVETRTVGQFIQDAQPQAYGSLHYFPASSQIVLRLHHALVDGIGSLAVLEILLSFLAEGETPVPKFGDEWQRLAPSLHQAAGFPDDVSAVAEQHSRNLLMRLAENPAPVARPVSRFESRLGSGRPMRFTKRFNPSISSRLALACKQQAFSVTSALHSAMSVSVRDNASTTTNRPGCAPLTAFNYRPYLQPPYNDRRAWPLGAYILTMPLAPLEGDFLTQARTLHQYYHQPLTKDQMPLFEVYETLIRKFQATYSTPHPFIGLSSLGIVDGIVQPEHCGKRKVALQEVETVIDQFGPELAVYVWSFRGSFCLSVIFNEAYYEPDWVQELFQQIQDTLFLELRVNK